MSDYQVRYTIQVFAQEAVDMLNRFKSSVQGLQKTTRYINEVKSSVTSLMETCNALARKPVNFKITTNITDAKTDLTTLNNLVTQTISNFERLQGVARTPITMNVKQGGATGASKTSGTASKGSKATQGGAAGRGTTDTWTYPSKLVRRYREAGATYMSKEARQLRRYMQSHEAEARHGSVRNAYEAKAVARELKREYAAMPDQRAEAHNRAAFKRLYPWAPMTEYYKWLRTQGIYSAYGNALASEGPLPKPGPRAKSYTAPPVDPKKMAAGYNIPKYNTSGYYVGGGTSRPSGGGGTAGTRAAAAPRANAFGNLTYKNLGPTPMPNNGGMAVDMLKGMGIAYGIAGIGSLISNIYSTSLEYENLTQSVQNILGSHDEKGNFSGRFNSMIRTVRDVGRKTKYTVTEVADAAKFLAMAGLDVEEIEAAIRPIANVALVGDTDLASTADLVTNIMTAYSLPTERMNWAADVMTNTFTRANVTLPEIAESMKYVAPIAMAAGVPFEDVVAAVGVLGDAGIKGSQAGTSLRRIIQNFVAPRGKKRRDAWNSQLGVERFDSFGNLRPLAEVFKELGQKNLKAEDYFGLFDVTASQAAAALSQRYSKLGWLSEENASSYGIASELGKKRTETLKGLWAQVVSTITDYGVSAFGGIEPQIRNLFKGALDYMGANDTPGNTERSDRFRQKMREVADTIMRFVSTLKQSTKWFLQFYKFMQPLIDVWVRYSLSIWPVTKALQAFASVKNSLLWLKSIPGRIGAITTSMRGLTSATEANTAASMRNGLFGNVYTTYTGRTPRIGDTKYAGLGQRQMKYAFYSKVPMHDEYGRFIGYQTTGRWRETGRTRWGTQWRWMKRNAGNRWGAVKQATSYGWNHLRKNPWGAGGAALRGIDRAGGGMVMGGIGAYKAIDQATSEDGSGWAAALYGIGAVASMFGPYGMLVGAVAMGAGAFVEYRHKVNLANEAVERLRESNKKWMTDIDGKVVNADDNNQIKFMNLLLAKEKDYSAILEMQITQIKEKYHLLETPPISNIPGTSGVFDEAVDNSKGSQGYKFTNEYIRGFRESWGRATDVWAHETRRFGVGEDYAHTKSISKDQATVLGVVLRVATEDPAMQQYGLDWMKRLGTAIYNGEDVSSIYDEFLATDPNLTTDEYLQQLPTVKDLDRLKGNENEIWQIPLIRHLMVQRAKNMMITRGQDPSQMVKDFTYWQQQLNANGDIMGAYAQLVPYIKAAGKEVGMITSDYTNVGQWAWEQLGWNGKGFVNNQTLQPLDLDDLMAKWHLLQNSWSLAMHKGFDKHMDNEGVATYMNGLDNYRRILSSYIYASFPDKAENAGVLKFEDNPYKFSSPFYLKKDDQWYEISPNGRQLLPIGFQGPEMAPKSFLNVPPSLLPYNPQLFKNPPSLLSQSAIPEFKPTINININAPMCNVEKAEVSNELDAEDLAYMVSGVLSDILNPESLARTQSFGVG